MKRVHLILSIALILMFVLSACSSPGSPAAQQGNGTTPSASPGASTATVTPSPAAPVDDDWPDIPATDWEYEYSEELSGAVITKYTSNESRVRIPDTVLGDPVVSIGDIHRVFYNEFNAEKSLEAVYIPSSVVRIGSAAFMGCKVLTGIIIPENVGFIGSIAFRDCVMLSDITLHSKSVYMDGNPFDDTYWYKRQPDGLVRLGNTIVAYKGEMPENTSIVIPEGVTHIASGAFFGSARTNLTSVTLPASITVISKSAFSFCAGLTSIVIPDSVTEIHERAFSDCESLTSVTLGNGLKTIGNSAFNTCTGLISITIPDSVTKIDWYAFDQCTGLISVTIPDSITEIAYSAFRGCTSLDEASRARILSINPDALS